MQCQVCNNNKATVHYTKIINGQIEELHLCEECAMNNSEFEFDSTFSFNKLLTGLIDNIQEGPLKKSTGNLICPFCSLDYAKFRQTGKFGCAECYKTFKSNLSPLLKGIHGHDKHVGKVPRRANAVVAKEREIEHLRNKLNEFISEEAFEKAAEVRDKIKELEKEIDEEKE